MKLIQSTNEAKILGATAIASAMAFVDMTAVNTALPLIQKSLGASVTDAQWIMEIYILFLSALLLTGGALGDRFGRLRVFRIGVLAFVLASLACGLSQSASAVILSRALQGAAAALLTPSSLALLNASFPPERRAHAIGSWAAITSLVVPLGPVLGGALAQFLSWHWIFLINLPLGAAVLYIGRGLERPRWDPPESAAFDLWGAGAITLGLGAFVYAALEIPRLGAGDPSIILGFIIAAISLSAFVVIESRVAHPMFPLSLLRKRRFAGINLATFFLFGGFQTTTFYLPFILIQSHDYTALEAGAALLPMTVFFSVLSRFAGNIVRHLGERLAVSLGAFISGAGLLILGWLPFGTDYATGYLPGVVGLATGMGICIAPLTNIALNAAGEGRSGLASSVNNAVARMGALIAIACLGIAFLGVYAATMQGAPEIAALPEAARAQIAANLLDLGAVAMPAGLDQAQQASIHDATRRSLLEGFSITMNLATVLCWIASFIAWRALRPSPSLP